MNEMIQSRMDAYIQIVMCQMKQKKHRSDIALELRHHLEDMIEDLLERELPLEEAFSAALHQMGDPVQ